MVPYKVSAGPAKPRLKCSPESGYCYADDGDGLNHFKAESTADRLQKSTDRKAERVCCMRSSWRRRRAAKGAILRRENLTGFNWRDALASTCRLPFGERHR